MLVIPLVGLVATAPSVLADETGWTVRMVQDKGENRISIENDVLFVDVLKKHFWTIRNIRYRDEEIVGEHGANGSVVNVRRAADEAEQDPWIGTGHGKEEVRSMTVLVDGKEHSYQPGRTLTGRTVIIRKVSNLGPLDHRAEITFPASGDRIVERHSYTVIEDLERRFEFVYAFMHCNGNALNQWFALAGEETELQGHVDKDDAQFSLKADVQAVGFYSAPLETGVVYAYPEVYEGEGAFKNSIWDRKRDNKLYFRPNIGDKYKVGDRFEFQVQVIPFSAGPEDWLARVRTLAEQG